MKTSFRSFLTPPSDEIDKAWASDNTIFIFDTNVLLNLYGFEEQTRADFFSTVSKLGSKIFLPFHVGLEYNMRRLFVIRNEKKTFRELNAISDRLQDKLSKDLESLRLKEKFPEVCELSEQMLSDIKVSLTKFKDAIEPWNNTQPDVRSEDKILCLIDKFSDGRIGPPPEDQNWLDRLYEEGALRYANRIPPGFRDIPKDNDKNEPKFTHNGLSYERKFGDLIIWKQILEEAQRENVENVIFVTDDAKDDWWSIIDSGGEKIIGPHEALRSEIYKLNHVKLFHMYSTSDFLDNGGRILEVAINESSIQDAIIKHVSTAENAAIIEFKEPVRQSLHDWTAAYNDRSKLSAKDIALFWAIDHDGSTDSTEKFKLPELSSKDYKRFLMKMNSHKERNDFERRLREVMENKIIHKALWSIDENNETPDDNDGED